MAADAPQPGAPGEVEVVPAACYTHTRCMERTVATSRNSDRQEVTVSLSRQLLKKAKILAARRETSISGLIAQEIECLVGEDGAFDCAERQASALLDRGFHLGGLSGRAGRTA